MSKKLILVIAEETSIREVVQACLSDLEDWRVLAVSSIECGCEQLLINQPDAIVLDAIAADVDGIQTLELLQRQPYASLIPVVVLSSWARWFTPRQLQQIGASGAIAKPFNPLTLPSQIKKALGW